MKAGVGWFRRGRAIRYIYGAVVVPHQRRRGQKGRAPALPPPPSPPCPPCKHMGAGVVPRGRRRGWVGGWVGERRDGEGPPQKTPAFSRGSSRHFHTQSHPPQPQKITCALCRSSAIAAYASTPVVVAMCPVGVVGVVGNVMRESGHHNRSSGGAGACGGWVERSRVCVAGSKPGRGPTPQPPSFPRRVGPQRGGMGARVMPAEETQNETIGKTAGAHSVVGYRRSQPGPRAASSRVMVAPGCGRRATDRALAKKAKGHTHLHPYARDEVPSKTRGGRQWRGRVGGKPASSGVLVCGAWRLCVVEKSDGWGGACSFFFVFFPRSHGQGRTPPCLR